MHLYVHDCDQRSVRILLVILSGDSCNPLCHDQGVHITTKTQLPVNELEEELCYEQ